MTLEHGAGSLESRQPLRALAVGTSERIRAAVDSLDDPTIEVTVERRTSVPEASSGIASDLDCVIVDDPDAVATLASAVGSGSDRETAIVLAVDEAGDAFPTPDAVDEVLTGTDCRDGSLLCHRLDRAVDAASSSRALERREAWYRSLLEHSSVLLQVLDEDRVRTYVSPAAEAVTGYEPSALEGSRVDDGIHPEDRDSFRETVETVRDGDLGLAETLEYRTRHADGDWHVHEATITNRLEDPTVEGLVLSVRDVTEYNRVESELQTTVDRIQDAFFALDTDWRFNYVNDRAEQVLGHDETELLGRRFLDVFPEAIGTAFQEVPVEAMRTQESRTLEAYSEELDSWIEARVYPSESGLSAYFRDVTERVERERELEERTERLEALVENVPLVMLVLDESGTIRLSEGRALETMGLEPGDGVGETVFDVFDDQRQIRSATRRALDGESVHEQHAFEDRLFESWFRPVTDDEGSVDRVIVVAVDETERIQYQRALSALHEATGDLLTAETIDEISQRIVDVAADVLDLSSVLLYRYDQRENSLRPAFSSAAFHERIGDPIEIGAGEGITWECYVSGKPAVYDDVQQVTAVHSDVTASRSGLFVPLGDHGVLVAVSPEPGQYSADAFELAQLLGATAEVAMDRIERTRRLRDRERELQRQNDRLERLNSASRVREDVEEQLLLADSREEIERGVCERLLDLDACSFAWIGEPDPGGNELHPRVAVGVDRGYLDAVPATAVDDAAAEPTGRAARTRRRVRVDNVADAVRDGVWRSEALSRGFQSVFSVPIVYDDFLYGVLSVYADRLGAFDEAFASTLSELAERVGYAIDAVKRKNALLSDDVTEIDIDVKNDSPVAALSTAVDATVDLQTVIPDDGGRPVALVAVGASMDAAAAAAVDGIDDASVLRAVDDRTILQLSFDDPTVDALVDLHGGRIRRLSADDGGLTATITVPQSVEVRDALSEMTRRGLEVSLVARRTRSGEDTWSTGGDPRGALLDDLTDRQFEVIQTAYYGGFFEWPRETTGEEIAASLDISPPAFHNHVRTVERKLFSSLFEGGVSEGLTD